jgi:diguanylate cyclase (GGDEF)-like protein
MDTHTFLVADRNPKFLEKTDEILREAGYRMLAAADGLEAKLHLSNDLPTGVLAHIDLPRLDGAELCRFIKEEHKDSVPVILMCPEDSESVALANAAGADNVLFRPVKRTELLFCARTMVRLSTILADIRDRSNGDELLSTPRDARASQFEFFKAFLTVEIKRARRYGFPLSLMLTSLDRSVEIEQQHGQVAIRQLLGGLARAIRRCVRDIDIPVTLRDDTILVLMPHTDRDGAYAVADRVRERIRRSVYHEGELFIQPTISIGQTTYDRDRDRNFSHVVRRASQAMREAARQGGDQVVVL